MNELTICCDCGEWVTFFPMEEIRAGRGNKQEIKECPCCEMKIKLKIEAEMQH